MYTKIKFSGKIKPCPQSNFHRNRAPVTVAINSVGFWAIGHLFEILLLSHSHRDEHIEFFKLQKNGLIYVPEVPFEKFRDISDFARGLPGQMRKKLAKKNSGFQLL